MKCEAANEAMMGYQDKTLKPRRAAALARHLTRCESCREYFVAFDEACETYAFPDAAREEAPAGFTDAVMERVFACPPHEARGREGTLADVLARVFWGVCAVLFGATLAMMLNREAVSAYLAANPWLAQALAAVSGWSQSVIGWLNGLMGASAASASPYAGEGLTALAFAAVLAVALGVLVRSDRVKA